MHATYNSEIKLCKLFVSLSPFLLLYHAVLNWSVSKFCVSFSSVQVKFLLPHVEVTSLGT